MPRLRSGAGRAATRARRQPASKGLSCALRHCCDERFPMLVRDILSDFLGTRVERFRRAPRLR
jgi:hypothetical protein